MREKRIREIERRLSDLEKEKNSLLGELSKLQSAVLKEEIAPQPRGSSALPSAPATTTEKIELFFKLFRCREDV